MHYTVKPKDTLNKIARCFAVPVELILSFNPGIVNPDRIYAGQIIYIPNTEDVPEKISTVDVKTSNQLISKARLAIGKGIRYKLGAGGMHPGDPLPTRNNLCDCSGFVCWVLGLSRKTDIPFYAKHGGWIYTDSMVADVNSTAGIFERLQKPEVGCIVVYGAGEKIGHVGIVSAVTNGQMAKVIHCSAGNDRKQKDAIQETHPEVFERADSVWGRFVG